MTRTTEVRLWSKDPLVDLPVEVVFDDGAGFTIGIGEARLLARDLLRTANKAAAQFHSYARTIRPRAARSAHRKKVKP